MDLSSLRNKIFSLRFLELLAVVFNLLYTALYIRESIWCWPFAFIGSALFVYLCYSRQLIAETVLQVFYVGFAVYGFITFNGVWGDADWGTMKHMGFIGGGVVLTVLSAVLLRRYTSAKLPLIDSFTTIFSLIATWIMVNYVHENWLYWIVVDTVSIFLYAGRKMYFGAVLFVIYLLLAINGYFELGWIS